MLQDVHFDPAASTSEEEREARAWQQVKHHAVVTAEQAEKRLLDLGELRAAVEEQLGVLDVRESETARRLHAESDQLVRQVRLREEELVAMLRDSCGLRRTQLQRVLESIAAKEKQLVGEKARVEERERDVVERAAAQLRVVELLVESAFFHVPDQDFYVVTSAPLVAERHLTLVQELVPSLLPSALTVPITSSAVHLPLRSTAVPTGIGNSNNSKACMALQDGVFHYIATAGGTKPFRNPVENDAVRVQCSAPIVLGELSFLCSAIDAARTTPAVLERQRFRTASQEKARIEIDFGDRRWVVGEAYALRHGHATEHAALRSWRLLGSRDRSRWVVLDEKRHNHTLGSAPFNVAAFNIDEERVLSDTRDIWQCTSGERCAFRYIALELTGPDAVGAHHLELSGMELYGYLVNNVQVRMRLED
ncbi:putative E3 ubiquitin-protein ligase HECTD1-like isoform X6 [Trypanosoma grayi]|uniref:putative E3 ubiquitin-protein ligase HECTD1-like isoform X6 n=1 Tax=Trypanosoma grayi TaxID=71804 RepID=UPI0004F4065D|nr:putative E3 ubiquitin-protein ligase HECTD1-like isoform X6 [Trypanosoma grayi]KEG09028.1 putative E3 ubiquitin-protein ligase HECTD1-like isoform X6 [Trypanosoma grayi]